MIIPDCLKRDLRDVYLGNITDDEMIQRHVNRAIDRPVFDLDGKPLEITTLTSDFKEFSTGPSNRRRNEYIARELLCRHIYKHKRNYYYEWIIDEMYWTCKCIQCNIEHFNKATG